MTVDTLFPAWTLPEPAIDPLLNRMKKMLTNLKTHENTLFTDIDIVAGIYTRITLTMSVFGLFCFLLTTSFSLSSSHLSIVSKQAREITVSYA